MKINQKSEKGKQGRKNEESLRQLSLLLLTANVRFKDVCGELGIPDPQIPYMAFWRGSKGGSAGKLRKTVLAHLAKVIRDRHVEVHPV